MGLSNMLAGKNVYCNVVRQYEIFSLLCPYESIKQSYTVNIRIFNKQRKLTFL